MRLPGPISRPLRDNTRTCRYCGNKHHYDLGCQFCSQMQASRSNIKRGHQGEGLQHQNLVKLAGHLASGLHSGFIKAQGSGGFYPTREELTKAAEWALEEFNNTEYCLRSKPNGSMTRTEDSL